MNYTRIKLVATSPKTWQLKKACSYVMSPWQHLYNGLALPADWFHFAQEWTTHLHAYLQPLYGVLCGLERANMG